MAPSLSSLREQPSVAEGGELDRMLAPAGSLGQLFAATSAAFWSQPHVPARTIELCRLHLARLHGCRTQMRHRSLAALAGVIDEKAAEAVLTGHWAEDPSVSAVDRAALLFAEAYWLDPARIHDEIAEDVLTRFGPAGFVCLVEAFGFLEGRIRLEMLLSSLQPMDGGAA